MKTSTWYFWKWAINQVDGLPGEVCEALSEGLHHPAIRVFDPAPLIDKVEQAKTTLGNDRSKWRWKVSKDPVTGLAHHAKLILPEQAWGYPAFQKWIDLFLPLGLFAWSMEEQESFPGTLPKKNVWVAGGMQEEVSHYEVKPEDVSRLMKPIGYGGTVVIFNHRNDYVNIGKAYGRYTVDWHHYPNVVKAPNRFSHWRAAYHGDPAVTAAGKPVERKFIPSGMDDERRDSEGGWSWRLTRNREYELLTPGDAAYVLRAFLRGESRPPHFRWISMTRRFPK